MAHGRKRCFAGGVFVGSLVVSLVVSILAIAVILRPEMGVVEEGRPLFAAKAEMVTLEWARLSPFPVGVKGFQIRTEGGPLTRAFRVAFFGDPSAMAEWVKGCPGVLDPGCRRETQRNGAVIYRIPPGGGAAFAKLTHHPQRGTIEIYTYWS